MTDLENLQDAFWTKFFIEHKPANNVPQESPFCTRCIKYDRDSDSWLETIVNFGRECNVNDKNIAVSLVLKNGTDAYEHFDLSPQDRCKIEGDEAGSQTWTDERVDGRRTIKLTREVSDLRENLEIWNEQHKWLYNRLQAFRRVWRA